MKRLIYFLGICLITGAVEAQGIQHQDEIGGGLGVMHYSGDLAPRLKVQDFSPAVQLFYRKNFPNNYSVLRVNMLVGELKASESNQENPLPEYRNLSFNAGITEFALLYEYNFLNFREISKGKYENYFLSPYVFGGLGAAIMWGGNSSTYITIPVGVGIKYQLSKNLNLGVEFGIRKTFTDKLDGYDDDVALNSSVKYDSYYASTFSLSYTFYDDLCAAHYKKW